jgi:ABC-type uncharacterized transport system fused permease/ATPase subunit
MLVQTLRLLTKKKLFWTCKFKLGGLIDFFSVVHGFNHSYLHRTLTARLALGWRIRMTNHLLQFYLRRNAFYKVYPLAARVFVNTVILRLDGFNGKSWLLSYVFS